MNLPQRREALVSAHAREHIQREHELQEALSAARRLQARLEMLGGHDEAVRSVRGIRDDLATHLDGHQIAETIDTRVTANSGFKEQDA